MHARSRQHLPAFLQNSLYVGTSLLFLGGVFVKIDCAVFMAVCSSLRHDPCIDFFVCSINEKWSRPRSRTAVVLGRSSESSDFHQVRDREIFCRFLHAWRTKFLGLSSAMDSFSGMPDITKLAACSCRATECCSRKTWFCRAKLDSPGPGVVSHCSVGWRRADLPVLPQGQQSASKNKMF